METDFKGANRKWGGCAPIDLFDAEVGAKLGVGVGPRAVPGGWTGKWWVRTRAARLTRFPWCCLRANPSRAGPSPDL